MDISKMAFFDIEVEKKPCSVSTTLVQVLIYPFVLVSKLSIPRSEVFFMLQKLNQILNKNK
jgi:hypothetical protein